MINAERAAKKKKILTPAEEANRLDNYARN
jgi:hypothetical protein